MKKQLLLLIFVLFFLCGCTAYRATYADMLANPTKFFSDINNISSANWTKTGMPFDIQQPWNYILLSLGGYGICFLRKFYQNYKRLKHEKK
jgi:hypothetical protein